MKKAKKKLLRFKEKNRAFTLVELLAVIVIIAIVLTIIIPSAVNMINTQVERKYKYHEQIVEEATDTYVDQYREAFEDEKGVCSCYNIPYNLLLEENLIKEEDITCQIPEGSLTKGEIIAYPMNGSTTNFRYEFYLTCKETSTGRVVHEVTTPPPTGCCGINGDFEITEMVVKYNDENGENYPLNDNNWTNQNVYQRFDAVSPYMAAIVGYEYSIDGGLNWIYVDTNHFTLTDDMNTMVLVRAVDGDGNRSATKTYPVRIDKTAPTADFEIVGDRVDGNEWYISNVNITPKNVSDGFGVGIDKVWVDHPYIDYDTPHQELVLTAIDKLGNKMEKTTSIKVDRVRPTVGDIIVTGTPGKNNWYISFLTVTHTTGKAGISGFTDYLDTTEVNYDTSGKLITLTTTAGNGLVDTTQKTVKVDTTPPTRPTGGGISENWVGNASGASENVSKFTYLYILSMSDGNPSKDSGSFSGSQSFANQCEHWYYAWAIAENEAGLRSEVYKYPRWWSGPCCTSPAIGSGCGRDGEVNECKGVYRYCRRELASDGCYWTGSSMSGSAKWTIRTEECSCTSGNAGGSYDSGGVANGEWPFAVLSNGNRTLTDYAGLVRIGQQTFNCIDGCNYRTVWR